MMIEDEYIRLIFGLKLKQIRTEKNLSLFGLAKLSGLSKSYLNEIEKGKKYPKTDKILLLSESLEVPYDHLVSLKLDKNLAPIGEILQSKILKEIPLELFGIKENNSNRYCCKCSCKSKCLYKYYYKNCAKLQPNKRKLFFSIIKILPRSTQQLF